jgi:catechol 2,3-dioxygenase-like lactoylglutathione lyase family enzyme
MNTVLFVRDINLSKCFYVNILGQKIKDDFGRYIGFENGFGLWQGEFALETIYSKKKVMMTYGLDNCEVYFEIVDLETLSKKLKNEGVTFIHPIQEHPWGQRSFRIYDPDGHIIEFGEPISGVVRRYCQQGLTINEIAEKTTLPLEMVEKLLS